MRTCRLAVVEIDLVLASRAKRTKRDEICRAPLQVGVRMTFYEAAIEVLRSAARPLHYKKITEIAVKRNLLSHVGKTPEITMGTRLIQEVQRASSSAKIVRTRPGVYALKAWAMMTQGSPEARASLEDVEKVAPASKESGERQEGTQEDKGSAPKKRRRRRRRRRKKEPQVVEAAPASVEEVSEEARELIPDEGALEAPEAAPEVPLQAPEVSKAEGPPFDLSDFFADVLSRVGRGLPEQELVLELPEGHPLRALPAAEARARVRQVLFVSEHVLKATGQRPRFVRRAGIWELNQWLRSSEGLTFDARLDALLNEMRLQTTKALTARMEALPLVAWRDLVLALLKRLGYVLLRAFEQPSGGIYWKMAHEVGSTTEIVVVELRQEVEIGADAVVSLRTQLSELEAGRGVLLGVGTFLEEAEFEALRENTSPVTLLDKSTLADLLVESGLGVQRVQVEALSLDESLWTSLGAGG